MSGILVVRFYLDAITGNRDFILTINLAFFEGKFVYPTTLKAHTGFLFYF